MFLRVHIERQDPPEVDLDGRAVNYRVSIRGELDNIVNSGRGFETLADARLFAEGLDMALWTCEKKQPVYRSGMTSKIESDL